MPMIFVFFIVFIVIPFLRYMRNSKYSWITFVWAVTSFPRFAVKFPCTVPFHPATLLSKNNWSRYLFVKWAAHILLLRRHQVAGSYPCSSYSMTCAQGHWFSSVASVWFWATWIFASFPFFGQKKAAGMNLRLKLVRYFVLGGVFRISSVYLMGENAKKGKV